MSWINTFDAVFFISLATILVGALGVSAKYCLRSKCEHFSCCWNCFVIDRRVDLETQEHLREIELGVNPDEEKKEEKEDNKV
jgi:hypothetical protein